MRGRGLLLVAVIGPLPSMIWLLFFTHNWVLPSFEAQLDLACWTLYYWTLLWVCLPEVFCLSRAPTRFIIL